MPAPANDNFASAEALSTTLPASLSDRTTFDATEESGEPDVTGSGAQQEQSIWFKFTPTTTGVYRFKIPLSSVTYNGVTGNWDGDLKLLVWNQSTLAGCTSANVMIQADGAMGAQDQLFTDPNWQLRHDIGVAVSLTSGTTYYIKVVSSGYSTVNRATCEFDLHWELLAAAASNDNFSGRTTISGASGSQAFNLENSTVETGEPPGFYWWEDAEANAPGVWFEWTCPSSGWYEFVAEFTDWARIPVVMGIYTGSAVNALTAIAENEDGGHPNSSNITVGKTVIRFNAVNGTVYKIAIKGRKAFGTLAYGGEGTLTWATASAPTGDTTGAALSLPINAFSLVDNYGNTDDELPPNGITYLSAHNDWGYEDGRIGRSKWWKFVAAANGTLRVEASRIDGQTWEKPFSEYGLLIYKGANFGSLTIAQHQLSQNAVLLGYDETPARTQAGSPSGATYMQVSFTAGETIWLCMVSLYDADYDADTVDRAGEQYCPQTNISIQALIPGPANDLRSAIDLNQFAYHLGRSEWGNYFNGAEAWYRDGTTVGATTAAEDPATIAGFACTRTVWYMVEIAKTGNYTFSIESSVDCVLGIWNDASGTNLGSLVGQDDDSGPGNTPELTVALTAGQAYWIGVDSKTEGNFRLLGRKATPASPPSNNDFANATVISSLPFSVAGSTVNASAEPLEREAEELTFGPKDTVWYKYVATANGHLKIKASCDTSGIDSYIYVDVWRGTTLEGLIREPPPTDIRGFFAFGDTPQELERQALTVDIVSGQTYYIRVQTESGGSEDFTIYVDVASVYLDLIPGGTEIGPWPDSAEIYLDLQPSGFDISNYDTAEIYLDLQPSGVEDPGIAPSDAATIYLDLQPSGIDEQVNVCFTGEGNPDTRWYTGDLDSCFIVDPSYRWICRIHKGAQYC